MIVPKIAAIQYKPPKKSVASAVEQLLALIEQAGKGGADLIVCPEMATTGYVWESPEDIFPYTEMATGESFVKIADAAKEFGSWIVCGFAERAEDGLFNSAWVIAPDGSLVCCYRKILLYDADYTWSQAGNRRYLVQTPFGRMVPAICMDLNDDGLIRVLLKEQPEIFPFCTNWLQEGEEVLSYWQHRLLGFRGIFVAANTWGDEEGIRFSGRSTILGPGGALLAQGKAEGNEVLLASID